MNICKDHWDKLREAIDLRGLSRFVAGSGEKAAAQLDDNSYDPLMAANFAIWNNALKAFGLSMMQEHSPCPLCIMDEHAVECQDAECPRDSGMDWIIFAADGQLELAKQKGLISSSN